MKPATRRAIPAAFTDRLLRARWVVIAIIAAVSAVVAGGHGDWDHFVTVGRGMFGVDGLHVYVRHPDTQTGPLTLASARLLSFTPRDGFVAAALICLGLGLAAVGMIERAAERIGTSQRTSEFVTLTGGCVVMFSWGKLGGFGHLDDAIVLTCAVAATVAALRRKPWWVATLLGIAIAAKPWAVILMPLVLVDVLPLRVFRWRSLGPAMLSGVIVCVTWLPFVVGAPGTLGALRPTVKVAADSVLALFGVTDTSLPAWLRVGQFVLALLIGFAIVLRGRYVGVLMAVIGVRLGSDPGTWAYYAAGLVVGGLLWDQLASRRRLPWAAIVASLLLAPTWLVTDSTVRSVLRLMAAIASVLVALFAARSPTPAHAPLDESLRDVPGGATVTNT